MIATDALTHLVRTDVLEFPERHEWSLQGFGMLRTYLAPDLRLHVWDPDYRVPSVSDIHDHPWHFESIVLAGTIENRRYRVATVGQNRPSHHRGRIVCGPNPVEHGAKDVTEVCLEQWCEGVFKPGDMYRMQADELHASFPSPGAVTLIQRTKANKDPERAFVYWPLGSEWVSAEPRPATHAEVKRITRRSLACWAAPTGSEPHG
jgi:hypothetical protein